MWIRTPDGNAINLALATDVILKVPGIDGGKYNLLAYFGSISTETIIATGTREDMQVRRDEIIDRLTKGA